MKRLISALLISVQAVTASPSESDSRDLKSAMQFSEAVSKGDLNKLRTPACSAPAPMDRLIAAYLLYKIDPKSNKSIFTRAFPTNKCGVSKFFGLYQSIPYSEQEKGNEYRYPQATWTIGFWSIYHAYLERVKAGDSEALQRFLQLEGHGDGEVGEGISSDITELFYHPIFVYTHWRDLERHKGYLRAVKNWASEEEFIEIRRGYEKTFPHNDSRRSLILNLLNTPE